MYGSIFFTFHNWYNIKWNKIKIKSSSQRVKLKVLVADFPNVRTDVCYVEALKESEHLNDVCTFATLFVEKNRNEKNCHFHVLNSILNIIFLFSGWHWGTCT